jgi:hypothetical protein
MVNGIWLRSVSWDSQYSIAQSQPFRLSTRVSHDKKTRPRRGESHCVSDHTHETSLSTRANSCSGTRANRR